MYNQVISGRRNVFLFLQRKEGKVMKEKKEELKRVIDNIHNPKVIDFILNLIELLMEKWGI